MIKHDMMNGNTINFKVLMKSSPGYEISVIVSLLSSDFFNNNPKIKRICYTLMTPYKILFMFSFILKLTNKKKNI